MDISTTKQEVPTLVSEAEMEEHYEKMAKAFAESMKKRSTDNDNASVDDKQKKEVTSSQINDVKTRDTKLQTEAPARNRGIVNFDFLMDTTTFLPAMVGGVFVLWVRHEVFSIIQASVD